jgi:hypothetical protein
MCSLIINLSGLHTGASTKPSVWASILKTHISKRYQIKQDDKSYSFVGYIERYQYFSMVDHKQIKIFALNLNCQWTIRYIISKIKKIMKVRIPIHELYCQWVSNHNQDSCS